MMSNWRKSRLRDVTTKIGSGATPKGGEKNYQSEGVSLIRSMNVHDGSFKFENLAYLSEVQAEKLSNVVVQNKDVLLNITGASIARCCVVPKKILPSRVNQHVTILRPDPDLIDSNFLNYLLISPEYKMLLLTSGDKAGATREALTKTQLQNFEIFFPTLQEQKRIVAILDQAFADIDKARALTEQNLKNARELFESYLQQVFSQRGEGWIEKTLGDAVIVERGSSPRPIKKFRTESEEGVNWVKIGDAMEGQKYITRTKEKITKEGATKSRFVDIGDFILSNSMSFGRPYIMAIKGYIHDGWFVLRLPEYIDPDYFYYLLTSPYLKGQFHQLAAGAIVKNISGDLVKKALLPIPPVHVQKVIAAKLDLLAEEISTLEGLYIQKAKEMDDLKSSLLQKAFAGKLSNVNVEVAA